MTLKAYAIMFTKPYYEDHSPRSIEMSTSNGLGFLLDENNSPPEKCNFVSGGADQIMRHGELITGQNALDFIASATEITPDSVL